MTTPPNDDKRSPQQPDFIISKRKKTKEEDSRTRYFLKDAKKHRCKTREIAAQFNQLQTQNQELLNMVKQMAANLSDSKERANLWMEQIAQLVQSSKATADQIG